MTTKAFVQQIHVRTRQDQEAKGKLIREGGEKGKSCKGHDENPNLSFWQRTVSNSGTIFRLEAPHLAPKRSQILAGEWKPTEMYSRWSVDASRTIWKPSISLTRTCELEGTLLC